MALARNCSWWKITWQGSLRRSAPASHGAGRGRARGSEVHLGSREESSPERSAILLRQLSRWSCSESGITMSPRRKLESCFLGFYLKTRKGAVENRGRPIPVAASARCGVSGLWRLAHSMCPDCLGPHLLAPGPRDPPACSGTAGSFLSCPRSQPSQSAPAGGPRKPFRALVPRRVRSHVDRSHVPDAQQLEDAAAQARLVIFRWGSLMRFRG